jgi:hypothetical protein
VSRGNTEPDHGVGRPMSLYRDRDEVVRGRLAVLRDQRAAIVARRRVLDVEQAELDREIAATVKRERDFDRAPVGEYVAVAIVALGVMTVGVGTVMWIHASAYRHSKHAAARIGAEAVFRAATARSFCETPVECMTLAEVVREKRLAPAKMEDPWGRAYRIACDDESFPLHVWSAGEDGVHGTADDIGDHFTPQDLARVAALE